MLDCVLPVFCGYFEALSLWTCWTSYVFGPYLGAEGKGVRPLCLNNLGHFPVGSANLSPGGGALPPLYIYIFTIVVKSFQICAFLFLPV
jgi:hypothetical protein